jgi:hypothetical protein
VIQLMDDEQKRDEDGFLRIIDSIIESCGEFIRDDGAEAAESYVMDMAAALHIRKAYEDNWKPEELNG